MDQEEAHIKEIRHQKDKIKQKEVNNLAHKEYWIEHIF